MRASVGDSSREANQESRPPADARPSLGRRLTKLIEAEIFAPPVLNRDNHIPSADALLCLSTTHPVRKVCCHIFQHHLFTNVILFLIIANSIVMLLVAARTPGIEGDVEIGIELTFTVAFTAEMVIKVVALGFVNHPGAYLRSGWNVLDFVIVTASLVSQAGFGSNFSVMRLLRVLRPLRTMSRVQGMKVLMGALFGSIPAIIDNVLLLGFLITTFGILAIQLFTGDLHKRCYITEAENGSDAAWQIQGEELPVLLGGDTEWFSSNCGGTIKCPDLDGATIKCQVHLDRFAEEPLNFDNMWHAVLLVFKVVSQDDWPDDQEKLMNATAASAWIFFVSCTVFGAFFGTNLFLAVLLQAFEISWRKESEKQEKERRDREEARKEQERSKLRVQLLRLSDQELRRKARREQVGLEGCTTTAQMIERLVTVKFRPKKTAKQNNALSSGAVTSRSPTSWQGLVSMLKTDEAKARVRSSDADGGGLSTGRSSSQNLMKWQRQGSFAADGGEGSPGELSQDSPGLKPFSDPLDDDDPTGNHSESLSTRKRECCAGPRLLVKYVVQHPFVERFMLFVTLLNVMVLAVDHHGIDDTLNKVLDETNLACTIVFAVEIILKILGFGWCGTFCEGRGEGKGGIDWFNCFDAFLVALSVPDLVSRRGGAFTAFRAFRMLRALRLVRRFPKSIQSLLRTTIQCFKDSVGVALVLLLQIFIFSILGMQLFEGKFPHEQRSNFNSLWEAAITTFVVIAGESWATVMKDGMLGTEEYAAVYFLLLFMLGNQIFVNAFVTIVLIRLFGGTDEEVEDTSEADELAMPTTPSGLQLEVLRKLDSAGGRHGPPLSAQPSKGSAAELPLVIRSPAPADLTPRGPAIPADSVLDSLDAGSVRSLASAYGLHTCRTRGEAVSALRRLRDMPSLGSCLPDSDSHDSPSAGLPLPIVRVQSSNSTAAGQPPVRVQSAASMPGAPGMLRVQSALSTPAASAEALTVPPPQRRARQMSFRSRVTARVHARAPAAEPGDTVTVRISRARPTEPIGATFDDIKERLPDGSNGDIQIVCSHVATGSPAAIGGLAPGMVVRRMNKTDLAGCTVQDFLAAVDQSGCELVMVCTSEESFLSFVPEKPRVRMSDVCVAILCYTAPLELIGRSLKVFSNTNCLRRWCSAVVHSQPFELFILAAITANLVFLALDGPNISESRRSMLVTSDYIFTVLFLVELVMKVIAVGLWYPAPPRNELDPSSRLPYPEELAPPYLRDKWNKVDGFVAISAPCSLFFQPLQVLRALRTVRLLIRFREIKCIVEALMLCFQPVLESAVVCGFILFVFGILGVQLFKGRLYECSDGESDEANCTGIFNDTRIPGPFGATHEMRERVWSNKISHFNHLGAAAYTLFEIAIGDGWTEVMFNCIDSRGVGLAPKRNSSPIFSIFFILFFVIGNFFAMNLIVGKIIFHFLEERQNFAKTSKVKLAMIDQGLCEDHVNRVIDFIQAERCIMKRVLPQPPVRPTNPIRSFFFSLIVMNEFDYFITACILLNMFVLATSHYRETQGWTDAQYWANVVFLAVFVAEAAAKLIALFPMGYFRDNWNKFDFAIVVSSTVGLWMNNAGGGAVSVVRVLRVGRLFRLMHKAKGLQKMFNTLFEGDNLVFFGNVIILLVACFFIFGLAGVDLFGGRPRMEGLTTNYNFDGVPEAMLTLFSISTTEMWMNVRNGVNSGGDGAGDWWVVFLYFLIFMVVGHIIMLNVFAAVVVELFDNQTRLDEHQAKLDALFDFRMRWFRRFGVQPSVGCAELLPAIFPESPDEESLLPELLRVAVARRRPPPADSFAGVFSCANVEQGTLVPCDMVVSGSLRRVTERVAKAQERDREQHSAVRPSALLGELVKLSLYDLPFDATQMTAAEVGIHDTHLVLSSAPVGREGLEGGAQGHDSGLGAPARMWPAGEVPSAAPLRAFTLNYRGREMPGMPEFWHELPEPSVDLSTASNSDDDEQNTGRTRVQALLRKQPTDQERFRFCQYYLGDLAVMQGQQVAFRDLVYAFAVRLFELGESDVALMQEYGVTRIPRYSAQSFTYLHWYAVMRIWSRWKQRRKERRGSAPRRLSESGRAMSQLRTHQQARTAAVAGAIATAAYAGSCPPHRPRNPLAVSDPPPPGSVSSSHSSLISGFDCGDAEAAAASAIEAFAAAAELWAMEGYTAPRSAVGLGAGPDLATTSPSGDGRSSTGWSRRCSSHQYLIRDRGSLRSQGMPSLAATDSAGPHSLRYTESERRPPESPSNVALSARTPRTYERSAESPRPGEPMPAPDGPPSAPEEPPPAPPPEEPPPEPPPEELPPAAERPPSEPPSLPEEPEVPYGEIIGAQAAERGAECGVPASGLLGGAAPPPPPPTEAVTPTSFAASHQRERAGATPDWRED